MSCDPIRDLLPLYAGGELEDNERVATEAHLAQCAACARELDRYREDRAALAGLRDGEAPTGTWRAIEAAVLPRKVRLLDRALPFAAMLMVGLVAGLAAHRAQRATAPVAPVETRGVVAGQTPYGGSALTVHAAAPAPSRRFLLPGVNKDGSFYLPRVETIPASGERDY